jgi:hypothetical protein
MVISTKNKKIKRRSVLALSALLIAALIIPQAALATDGSDAYDAANQNPAPTAQDIEITTEDTFMENPGGGGR